MKYSLFWFFLLASYTVVTARTVEEVVEEARKEVEKNAKEIDSLFQDINTLQNRLYSIEKQIIDESENITNEVNKKNQETLELINKIDKEKCRVKAKKDLGFALNLTITDINISCQLLVTIELINELKHDLKGTQESLTKLNKTNGETIEICLNIANQQAEEFEKCFKAKDIEIKDVLLQYKEIVKTINDKVEDIYPPAIIRCFQVTLSIFNQITDQIIADAKKCDDCLHLQLYRDSKDRYKQGQTKASLSLQHFLGIESGFTLDKESHTIAIICQDVIVVLAFENRERLIQWQVKISTNLGEDLQYSLLISTVPSKAKVPNGSAKMHVQDYKFCLTTGVPPRLAGVWEIAHLRRYGVVEGRFCFEGGSRCGKGEGLYVLITDQGSEITQTLQSAAQGKLSAKRRPVSRKTPAMDSPRKQLHPRSETRNSDVSCLDTFASSQHHPNVISNPNSDMSRSLYSHEDPCQCANSLNSCMQHNDDLVCAYHRTSSPYNWSTESHSGLHPHSNADLDFNYGCGDTVSVSEMHDIVQSETWTSADNQGRNTFGQPTLERCMSCISKMASPSMSRSATDTVGGGTCSNGPPFNPAWTMENSQVPTCTHRSQPVRNTSDRMSVCSSHGSSSGNSEYSIPRQCIHDVTRNISSPTPPNVPPKSPKNIQNPLTLATAVQACQCPPLRPPKPPQLSTSANNSPIKKKPKKLPMPLPITTPLKPANPTCPCQSGNIQESTNKHVGPYENYDIPKTPLLVDPKNNECVVVHQPSSGVNQDENYDTPKKIMECLASEKQSMHKNLPSVQTMSIRKPCGCILKFNKKTMPQTETKLYDHYDEGQVDCPCRRVTPMCWPGNWMTIPYCRRGNGMENTSMPITQIVPESKSEALYATVDKTKKSNRKLQESCITTNPQSCMCPENDGNYANVEPLLPPKENKENIPNTTQKIPVDTSENYENIDFAQSLEHYENAKQLLQKAGITQDELDRLGLEMKSESQQHCINSSGTKYCHKCGHTSTQATESEASQSELEISQDATMDKQDDYLMMEPGKTNQPQSESVQKSQPEQHPFPGYIPMSPITNTDKSEKVDLLKHRVNRLMGEKSSSNPSLVGPAVDRSRKRSDSDMRIPGAAMLMHHHFGNSPYNRKQIMDSSDCIENCRKFNLIARKRSNSADSSRFVEGSSDDLDLTISRTTSPSTETLRKLSLSSLTTNESTQIEHRLSSPCLHQETEPCYSEKYCRKLSIDVNSNETEGEDNSSLNSDSLRTQVTTTHQQTVNIRRSSSVPCKSGQNRDSSSSNDSGVSTGSLKHRGADFSEFELPLTTSLSSRRHHHYAQRLMIAPTNCLHSSLPRRSKSSDPLRELTFQFQKIKIPAKSSSAEAEVPIFSTKGIKGFSSPADSSMGPPYIDSRSTSSGTSDMSDYIETLSLSSHSSSDAADLRLIRQPTTTLRPRSGKEYHNIDRSMLVGQHGLILDGTMKLQTCGTGNRSHGIQRDPNASYANITPVPEKSESPSPGYMSGSSPSQENPPTVPQTLLPESSHFNFQTTQ